MNYLDSKEYNWVGIPDAPGVRGKLTRTLEQFTPYSWTRYEWRATEDIRRLGYVAFMVGGILVCELDAFFLKFILLLGPRSPLNVYRLLVWWAIGMVALRDYYAFMTDASIKRLGSTCWVVLAVLIMELAVVIKFGTTLPAWQGKHMPAHIAGAWAVVLLSGASVVAYWYLVELPRREAARGAAGAVRARPAAAPAAPAEAAATPGKAAAAGRGRSATPAGGAEAAARGRSRARK
jgi:phosphatidylserine synthase 2